MRYRVPLGSSAVLALLLNTACTQHAKPNAPAEPLPEPTSSVDRDRLEPEASTRMQLAKDQVFIPGELSNPEVMPVYPPALLPQLLPDQTVCVRFAVGEDGSVSSIAPVTGVAGCPADVQALHPEFLAATIDAVSQWDFYSSIRCTFPPGTPDALKCNGPGTVAEQVAVTLGYRFLFSAQSGVSTVREGAGGK